MLTCLPVSGAEAVKKTCWSSAWEAFEYSVYIYIYIYIYLDMTQTTDERGRTQSLKLSGMESQNCTIAQIAKAYSILNTPVELFIQASKKFCQSSIGEREKEREKMEIYASKYSLKR